MQIIYKEIDENLLKKIIVHYGNEELIKSHINLENGNYSLAAFHEDKPVGFISVCTQNFTVPLEDKKGADIAIIEVDKNYRRKGIARELVSCAEKWAKSMGLSQIRAWSSYDKPEAIKMWHALNYCMCPATIWVEWCKEIVDGYHVAKRLNPTDGLDKEFLLNHWYADIYEQKINKTDEAEFVLSILKDGKYNNVKTILDVCCGGGRNTVPIANAGYKVSGFDADEYMLEKLQKRIERDKIKNISWRKSDAIKDNWGKDFDVVVLAGNIFVNIYTEGGYSEAQELFIKKASECVKPGGYMYLDFDCSVHFNNDDENDLTETEKDTKEWIVFEGTDDIGTYGKFIMMCDKYINGKLMARRRFEITPKNGEKFDFITYRTAKHFPTFDETKTWLDKYGWEILRLYGSRNKENFNENTEGNRAVIWARKN
ncbi:MAG: GNAT family N-acetyltransferase [Oscillospiraceae bacterium]|nr:GNAT family N-acetyltransferase [Oscillospiraceae bacterium]